MKYFISVVECNSFTEAAEQCYISQSAISQQIRSLEKELGVELIHRENRRFTLTPAGEYFYEQSKGILNEVEDIRRETFRIGKDKEMELKIGYLRCYSGQELHQAVAEFPGFIRRFPFLKCGCYAELYYKNTLGFGGRFLFAENLEEGRLMVAGNRGFLPVERVGTLPPCGTGVKRLPVMEQGQQLKRNYCLFWVKENASYYIEEFAEILRKLLKE